MGAGQHGRRTVAWDMGHERATEAGGHPKSLTPRGYKNRHADRFTVVECAQRNTSSGDLGLDFRCNIQSWTWRGLYAANSSAVLSSRDSIRRCGFSAES